MSLLLSSLPISNETNNLLLELVLEMEKASELVNGNSISSNEQNASVNQVNNGVRQLNRAHGKILLPQKNYQPIRKNFRNNRRCLIMLLLTSKFV